MKKLITLLFLLLVAMETTFACTNILVTKGASADGSCMLLYTNDGEWLYQLKNQAAARHQPGDSLLFTSREGIAGKIAQVDQTYHVLGFQMNEFQVAIGETTFTGREELWNKSKFLEYWHLMSLALERSRTAREAVEVITTLVETYGYASEGESFSIIDPNEAWILEMIGTGTGNEGAVWVAVKIPDGMISAHANRARIGEFPLNDPENCRYSKNIISLATQRGYYNRETDGPFRFNEVYCPATPESLKYCETRVWSIFRRAAPSLRLSPDYHRAVNGASRYPLCIVPDQKLTLASVMALGRDHYEGTPFFTGTGVASGPFNSPNRNRPLSWTVDSTKCSWERTISTSNTAFSFIAQARGFLPNETGGKVWWGVDDTWYTCYVPIYACNITTPLPFAIGDMNRYDPESAWWAFNFVSNFSNLRYNEMINDIQQIQQFWEQKFLREADSLERAIAALPSNERISRLTNYSNEAGQKVTTAWQNLGKVLVSKYNDGYIKDSAGQPQTAPYSDNWYRTVLKNDRDHGYPIPEQSSSKKMDYQPF